MTQDRVLRIRAVPAQPHCFFYGGFDIQMVRTLELMRAHGLDAQPLDPWSRDRDFDVIHVWGLAAEHRMLVRAAKQNGKKVVLTPLLPYVTLENWARLFLRLIRGSQQVLRDVLRHTDRLLVVNDLQAEAAARMFRFPREHIEVIPTIIDAAFFSPSDERPLDDLENYVVCAGNIWPRKNQLRLAQASLKAGVPVVFVGNVMDGEDAYTAEFASLVEAQPSLRWHKWVSWPDLKRIFQNASGVALPSFVETQPAAGLEAAAMQKPLLLGDRSYARQSYFRNAYLAEPLSVDSIAKGLASLRSMPLRHVPPQELISDCHPDVIGPRLKSIFETLLNGQVPVSIH